MDQKFKNQYIDDIFVDDINKNIRDFYILYAREKHKITNLMEIGRLFLKYIKENNLYYDGSGKTYIIFDKNLKMIFDVDGVEYFKFLDLLKKTIKKK